MIFVHAGFQVSWNLACANKFSRQQKLSKMPLSIVAKLSWLFGRSAWVLVMIKPHANLCPLNQSVDSMSPNTWWHFSSGNWRVAFWMTWLSLMECSGHLGCRILALALLVHGHARKDSSKGVCSCLLSVVWEVLSVIEQVLAVLLQCVLTFWKKCLSACDDQTTC